MEVVNGYCPYVKVRARNVSKTNLNLAIDVKINDTEKLIDALMDMENVHSASIVEHDGDVTA